MSRIVTKTYTVEELDRAILSVEKKAGNLQQQIHNVAVSILRIWQEKSAAKKISDEDALIAAQEAVERLNKLQSASPYHANAFSKWVGMFCPVHWAEETKLWYVNPSDEYRMMGKMFMEARDKPFWKVSPPAKPKPFVMYDELQRIYDRYVKHCKKPVDGDAFDSEAAAKLKEVMALLEEKGLKVEDAE